MKKAFVIISAIIGGTLCNALICAVVLWLWDFNLGICLLAAVVAIVGFCALLNVTAKKLPRFGVKRGVLPVCTQTPTAVITVLFFVDRRYDHIHYTPRRDMWAGLAELWTGILYNVSKILLAVAAVTTVCAFINVLVSYLNEISKHKEDV